MQLADSIVFISGANRGLGLAFVAAAFAAGARKVYAGMRDPAAFAADLAAPDAAERLERAGFASAGEVAALHAAGRLVFLPLDVTDPVRIAQAAAAARDTTLLVNNAGVSRAARLLDRADAVAAAREELETNFFGPWALTRAFAPVLAANGGGAVLNVLSVLSWLTLPAVATYSASKAAAWSLSNGLRHELSAQATQVVSLHVAYMDTDMTRGLAVSKLSPPDVARRALAGVEAGLIEVLADDVTRSVKQRLSADEPAYA